MKNVNVKSLDLDLDPETIGTISEEEGSAVEGGSCGITSCNTRAAAEAE